MQPQAGAIFAVFILPPELYFPAMICHSKDRKRPFVGCKMKVMVFDVGGTEIKYSVMDEQMHRTNSGAVSGYALSAVCVP